MNFWSYVDARDAAATVETGLSADVAGHEAFNCVAGDNALGRPLRELFEAEYGTVPSPAAVDGDDGVCAVEKARERLGWAPEHSWRTAADEDADIPRV